MAAITAKAEQSKKARVDKAMDSMKTPEKPAGTLRHISITPADNGYSVDVDRDMPVDTQKVSKGEAMPSSTYQPPTKSVFGGDSAIDDALAHARMHMQNPGKK